MDKIDAIRNRSLSQNSLAKIQAMASVSDPEAGVAVEEIKEMKRQAFEGGEEGLLPPVVKNPVGDIPVNDVAFYGPRVLEFYQYFLNKTALEGTAATLALACATLKSCVVIGQAITDAHSIKIPAIPVNAAEPIIPAVGKKKRGRPFKVKK